VDTSRQKRERLPADFVLKNLMPGDIILYGNPWNPLSILIQWITISRYSHAEIYIGGGMSVGAHFRGIQVGKWTDWAGFLHRMVVLRVKDATDSKRGSVKHVAISMVGQGYDFIHLFQYLWRIILGTLGKAPMVDAPHKHVCFEFAATCWHECGIKVGGKYADNVTGRSLIFDSKLESVFG
jgi:hypothetical protein